VQSGVVEAIYITAEAAGRPEPVDTAKAVAGRGLEGDRYFAAEGTFSDRGGDGRDVTLIEAEALEGLARENGIELGPGESRRNVVTRGMSLNDLVGKRFRIGQVECVGRRLADPCTHLESLTQPGVLKGLVDRGGLRADITRGGAITVGSPILEIGAEP
jgi:MOSC domain-containing protein YiiM